MSLVIVPEELVYLIWNLTDNKGSVSLACTNKWFNATGNQNGYVKHMSIGRLNDDSTLTCVMRYLEHKRSLHSIHIERLNNPQSWISGCLPIITCFNRCHFTTELNPPPSNTEILTIRDQHRHQHNNTLRINWSKFPKLKVLDLYVFKVNLSGIEACRNLNSVKISCKNIEPEIEILTTLLQNVKIEAG